MFFLSICATAYKVIAHTHLDSTFGIRLYLILLFLLRLFIHLASHFQPDKDRKYHYGPVASLACKEKKETDRKIFEVETVMLIMFTRSCTIYC